MFHSFVTSAVNSSEWSGSYRSTYTPRESAPSPSVPQSRFERFGKITFSCLILVSFSTTSRRTLGPTQPPIHRIPPTVLRRVKVKVLPIQATKALRVGRGIALSYLRPRH